MSNSNSFNNNSVDNNNNRVNNMNNEINLNEVNSAEAIALLNGVENNKSSLFDNLDSDVVFEYEQSTDDTDTQVVNNKKGLPMECHSFTGYKTYGNPNAVDKLTLYFNIEHRLVSWKSPVSRVAKTVNPRLIQVFEYVDEEVVADCKAVDTTTTEGFQYILRAIAKTIHSSSCATVAEAVERLEALIGTVFISQWEEDELRPGNYNTNAFVRRVGNVVDAQVVARQNEISAFHVNDKGVILDKSARSRRVLCDKAGKKTDKRGSSSNWVKGCLETAIAKWGFCFTDKTNSKRAFAGDALQAIGGLSKDGMKSLVVADKEGKAFARHAMCKHISAAVEDVSRDNFYGEMADGGFSGHYGQLLTTTWVDNSIFSATVGDGGGVLRTALTGTILKRLHASFNIVELRASDSPLAKASLEEIEAKVIERLCEISSLAPHEVVMFEGQRLLRNGRLPVVIKPQTLRASRKRLNTETGSLVFNIACETVITDYNWKLRGLWLKAMTSRNDDVVLAGNSSDLIINANSVKNKKAMLLRMWANHSGNRVAFCKDGAVRHLVDAGAGNLVLGQEVDEEAIQKYIDDVMTEEVELTFVAHHRTVAKHKAGNPSAFANAVISEVCASTGNQTVSVKVKTITAPLVVALELSSVAENAVVGSRASHLISDYATTFGETANTVGSSTIRREAERQAKVLELCLSGEIDKSFKLTNSPKWDDVRIILKDLLAKNHTPAMFFKALSQKFPSGIEIKGHTGIFVKSPKRQWSVVLPTQLLAIHGRFDKEGYSHDAKVEAVYAFLSLIASGKQGKGINDTLADCAFAIGKALEAWKKDVVEGKGTLTKTSLCFAQHSFKVIANGKDGWQEVGGHWLPVISLSNTNPLVQVAKGKKSLAVGKDGRNAKVVRDGDIVFFYRNPQVLLGVAVAKVVDESVVGKYAAAIAPDAFALNNDGDFDGDAICIVPANQFGIRNINTDVSKLSDVSTTPVEQVKELMSHPLLAEGLAERAIRHYNMAHDETLDVQILGGICKTTSFKLSSTEMLKVNNTGTALSFDCGLVFDRTAQMKEFNVHSEPNDDGSPISFTQVWIEDATATAHHYQVRVGQGYSVMFNAVNEFIARSRTNRSMDEKELLAVMAASIYCYEGLGLSGYSLQNEQSFEVLVNVAKEILGLTKPVSYTTSSFQPISMLQNSKEVRTELNEKLWNIKPLAQFFAMAVIQSRLDNPRQAGLQSSVLFDSACKHSAFRSLTKGMYSSNGRVANALRCATVNSAEPYAPILEVLVSHSRFKV